MAKLRSIIRVCGRVLLTLLFIVMFAVLATSISVIYDFAPSKPFSGSDIYNPYASFDPEVSWKRTTLHTHTRVAGPLNECEYDAMEVYRRYAEFGYDIVGISNHNEITPHPAGMSQHVNMYEHGYNLRNFHKLVIGSEDVNRFDALFPLFASQAQWQLDMLASECDVLQLNHPSRSSLLDRDKLSSIAGYDIMELSGVTAHLENVQWDWALSAGRYSFGLLNDDLHFPDRSDKFAVRCSYLCSPSDSAEDLVATLRSGCFYAMRIPDYGNGDWEVKRAMNGSLPSITNIGMCGDTIYLKLSESASLIRVIGENHRLLARAVETDSLAYRMGVEDSYARVVVSYPDSLIIMTNPFARYDAQTMSSPGDVVFYSRNVVKTVLYNIGVVALVVVLVWLYVKIVRRWREKQMVS